MEANDDLCQLARKMGLRGRYGIVEASFLELAEPSIFEGGKRCVDEGAEQVILLPYFLSAGVHVQRDLTTARERLAVRYSDVDFRLAEPLGRHPLLTQIVSDRAREALDR